MFKHVSDLIQRLLDRGYVRRESPQVVFKSARKHFELEQNLGSGDLQAKLQPYRIPAQFMRDEKYLVQRGRADWRGADRDLIRFSYRFYMRTVAQGIPMYAHTVYRSFDEQKRLQSLGHSNLSDGPHQRGAAVDFVHSELHWEAGADLWEYLGVLGKEVARTEGVEIEWGGDWSNLYDPAHWQLPNWRSYPLPLSPEPLTFTLGQLKERAR